MAKVNVINVSKIKGLMAEQNENIEILANYLKIHRNTLSDKLNLKTEFKVNEIKFLANHYNVSVNIFFN